MAMSPADELIAQIERELGIGVKRPARAKPGPQVWQPPDDHMERPPTEAEVWEMVAGSTLLLRRETRKSLHLNRRHEFEEMYSDVVIARAHSIMATWRVGKGAAWLTHLVNNAKWYAYKWSHRRNGHWKKIKCDVVGTPVDNEDTIGAEQEAVVGVRLLLEALPDQMDAAFIRWRAIEGLEFGEIASYLRGFPEYADVTQARARIMYLSALSRARELLWREGPAGDLLERLNRELKDLEV